MFNKIFQHKTEKLNTNIKGHLNSLCPRVKHVCPPVLHYISHDALRQSSASARLQTDEQFSLYSANILDLLDQEPPAGAVL